MTNILTDFCKPFNVNNLTLFTIIFILMVYFAAERNELNKNFAYVISLYKLRSLIKTETLKNLKIDFVLRDSTKLF